MSVGSAKRAAIPPEAAARRSTELGLVVLAVILAAGGYVLTALAKGTELPADLVPFAVGAGGLALAAHVAVRRFAPRADGTLLGLAILLNGIGFVTIARLDPDLARYQSLWTAVGVGAFVATLAAVKRIRDLERYRYTFALVGIGSLILPAIPGIGREINGARLWVRLGPLNFQPGEAAKVTLVIFLAAYLVEKRELLSTPTWRVGPADAARPQALRPPAPGLGQLHPGHGPGEGPRLLAAVLRRVPGHALHGHRPGQLRRHRRRHVRRWGRPSPTRSSATSATGSRPGSTPGRRRRTRAIQLVQALFAFGSGGFAGAGLGLGRPGTIPNASTDFVFAAIGEELGLIGTTAVLLLYLLLVGVGFRIALRADQPFLKLLAAGLTTILGVQTFIILGGVTRLIPLTGITMPFVSYGGSSLLANFVILALLLRISDEVARRSGELHRPPRRAERREPAGPPGGDRRRRLLRGAVPPAQLPPGVPGRQPGQRRPQRPGGAAGLLPAPGRDPDRRRRDRGPLRAGRRPVRAAPRPTPPGRCSPTSAGSSPSTSGPRASRTPTTPT